MNTLVLGKRWLVKFSKVLPASSSRMRTRLAWRLAALSIDTDDALKKVNDLDLTNFIGGSSKLVGLRDEYIQTIAISRLSAVDAGSSSEKKKAKTHLVVEQPVKKPYLAPFASAGLRSANGLQPTGPTY